jgi:hypothetical protein
MRLGLDEAVSHDDLQRARRYIDRLKGIVIDSLMQDDPVAIRLAGNALRQSGERLELFADQPMVFDKAALAWQLRAEAGTAALAARVRPAQIEAGWVEDVPREVPALLLRVLGQANAPMSNTALAARTAKDPAVISRALKRLEREGRVRRWRGPKGQQLNAVAAGQAESSERLNRRRLAALPSADMDVLKHEAVQAAAPLISPATFLNPVNGKRVLKPGSGMGRGAG